MGVTKAMTRHLAIFTTCPELGYLLPESFILSCYSSSSTLARGNVRSIISRKDARSNSE